MVLLDTDVIVAGLQHEHVHYERARAWLDAAENGTVDAVVSATSIYQTFRVLTSVPRPLRVEPGEAMRAIDDLVVNRCRVAGVGCRRQLKTLRRLAARGIAGGAVYDGLIAEVGRAERVEKVVTFNVADFRRVAPDLDVVAP
jgi:predicted nucleic acid-binding protein